FTSAEASSSTTSARSLMLALMIMKSSTAAPKPQAIASRNDSENTLVWRRLTFTSFHPDDQELGARNADAHDVAARQHNLAVHALLVHERAVAAEIDELELAVPQHDLAVLARDAARLVADDERAAAVDRHPTDDEAVGAHAVGETSEDDVRRRLDTRRGGRTFGSVRTVCRKLHGRTAPREAFQELHLSLRGRKIAAGQPLPQLLGEH